MNLLLVKAQGYEEIVIDFTDFERTCEQNLANWQISFNITRTSYNSFAYDLLMSDQCSLLIDGQEYVVQQLNPVVSGTTETIAVTATHIYFDIQKKIRVKDVLDDDYEDGSKPTHTLAEYLAFVFQGNTYGYSYEIRGSFTKKVLIDGFGSSDGMSLINTLVETFSCYLNADNQKVIFMDDTNFKIITQKQFRWLYNTDDINLQLDKTNLRTQCWVYPYMDEHGNYFFEPYIYKSANVSRFGESFADTVDLSGDAEATTKEYTDKKAVKELQDVPETTFTMTYYGKDIPVIGEVWMAIIEPMKLDVDVPIVGIKDYPFDDSKQPELTLSNAKKDMLSIQRQIANKANNAYRRSSLLNGLIANVDLTANEAWSARLTLEAVGEVIDGD
ncbi:prophage endopeptidase tail family protein [Niallia sp. 03091]|uniref:prophage endopeptidase tail family protein n=1 Tax=Niallia sp. 03091 TaxID=3458059 RepID=UPI00404415AB